MSGGPGPPREGGHGTLPDGYDLVGGWSWKPDRNEFVPDVMAHPRTTESVRFTGTPALAVEVLSTNRGDDLVVKLNRYAQAGLPHDWILDPSNRVLLAYGLTGEVYDLLTVVDQHNPGTSGTAPPRPGSTSANC